MSLNAIIWVIDKAKKSGVKVRERVRLYVWGGWGYSGAAWGGHHASRKGGIQPDFINTGWRGSCRGTRSGGDSGCVPEVTVTGGGGLPLKRNAVEQGFFHSHNVGALERCGDGRTKAERSLRYDRTSEISRALDNEKEKKEKKTKVRKGI